MSSRFPKANKSFGQHFLTSSKVIQSITQFVENETDAIVEVGPGPAVLTPHLAHHKLPFYVIEMDKRFSDRLLSYVKEECFFREDALKFDWHSFLKQYHHQSIWLVSNLPYNISVPLTLKFLKVPEIKSMTLMYQKEVAQKILPKDLKNQMNSLYVLIKTQFEVKHLVDAPPGAFTPSPKVQSQVLSFTRKKHEDISLHELHYFERFLRDLFSQRRKQLGSLLKKILNPELVHSALASLEIDFKMRSESLSYEQVLQLYLQFKSSYNNDL